MARDRPLLWVEPCGYGYEDEAVGHRAFRLRLDIA